MRRLPVIAALVAATLLLLAAPISAAPSSDRVFKVLSGPVRAGQQVKVYGRGCGNRAAVRLYIDGIPIETDQADRLGRFVAYVEVPVTADLGKHRMKATCSGHGVGSDDLTVMRARFNINPRTLEPGDNLTAAGNLCPSGALVSIALDGGVIGYSRADGNGKFRKTKQTSSNLAEGRHVVSSRCGGRAIGSMSLRVVDAYPASTSTLLTTDRSSVPAGQAVTVSGGDCPTGRPAATLDGQTLALATSRATDGGFTATATIPGDTAPGRHQLWAGCDAGSAGTTELDVLDPASVENAVATQAFAPSQDASTAISFGLLAGIALLAASVAVARRRS